MADVDTAQEARSRWAKDAIPVAEEVPPFAFVLVKLASRCNINCTYCYWFRDVYCDSWKRIFSHIWERISPTLIVEYETDAASSPIMPNA